MSLRFVTVCLAATLLLGSCFVPSSLAFFEKDTEGKQNLVRNHGFAPVAGTRNTLSNWSIVNDEAEAAASVNLDHDVYLEGRNSIRIDSNPYAIMIVSDPFKVRRYGGYYVRVNARFSEDKGEKIELKFFTYNAAGKHINRFKTTLKTNTEWQKASLSAGFLDTRSEFGRVAILIPPFLKGTLWIDDAGAWEVHSFKID